MKSIFLYLILLTFIFASCETDLKEGHYTCDPNEPGACPDGWVCQLRGTDGVFRCYESAGSFCQDGVRDEGEICDGEDLGDFTCEAGWPICLTNCTAICTECGNGRIELSERGVGEACDDGNTEDGDGCSATCEIERSYCVTPASDECLNWCGDGTINGPELCEPTNLGGADCTDFGYHDGALGCTADCRAFDFSACAHFCGDGQVHEVETCDGLDQARRSCWDYYFTGGDLHCDTGCLRDFSGCFDAWDRQNINTLGSIQSIHGTDGANLFAVSFSGWVGRFDGVDWTNWQLPDDPRLRAVFAFAPDDAWAAGNSGALWHFNGDAWTLWPGAEEFHLTGLWGASHNEVYACGFWPGNEANGYSSEGVVLKYDGAGWTEVLRDFEEYVSLNLMSIHGSGPDDVWVAGQQGRIWHWDGTTWERLATTPEQDGWYLNSVYVLNPTQRVFSGADALYQGFAVLHENDAFTPIVTDDENSIKQVRGTSAEDLWAVLDDGSVLRREAGGWRNLTPPLGSQFTAMWNDHPDTLWVGGANGLLMVYGGEFETVSFPFPQSLLRVWGADDDDLYATGMTGALHHLQDGVWTPETIPGGLVVHDLWGPDADTVMAVGNTGKTALRTGGTWAAVASGVTTHLRAVHGCGASELWAAGWAGTILRWDGAAWQAQTSGSTEQLNDIHCVTPTSVFAVGNNGVILRHDGVTWQTMTSGTTKNLNAVWGSSPSHVYAVGNDGTILFFDGTAWRAVDSGVGVTLKDITGTNSRNVWVVGNAGVVLRNAGVRFSRVAVHGSPNLARLHLQPNGRLVSIAGNRLMEYRSLVLPQPFVAHQCPASVPLYCQEARLFDTTGMPDRIGAWDTVTGLDGPETAFFFQAPFTGTVTWTLDPSTPGARLIVLGSDAYDACDAGTAVAVSSPDGDGHQAVSLPVTRNEVYYLIIDSPTIAAGALNSTCVR